MKLRIQTVVTLIVAGAGLLLVAMLAFWGYINATATRLHPDPQDVPSVAQSASPQWAGAVEQARQIVRADLAEQNLPGLSVAVGAGGEVVWAEGFGWADLENQVRVAPDMRFRIGTASTVLTSAAVGLLLEKGRLTLDDPIQTYVPAFPQKQWPVTLRQLMGHVAGVRNDGGDEGPLLAARCEQTGEGLRDFAERPLLFEPGTRFHYSSYGWILVSAAVEAAADEPFFSFMRKHIFEPLGMNATRAESAAGPVSDRVTFYFPRVAADPRYGQHLMREINHSCYAGAAAFLSTPSDLVRFGMAMSSGKLLEPATVQELQTPQRLSSSQETGYGLGWDLETVAWAGEDTQVAGHDGDVLGGRVASLLTFPGTGVVVSVIANISYADTFTMASKIAQAFADAGTSPARK
jgi:serine beta-lactamase-like protein LACTB, mitochondrial